MSRKCHIREQTWIQFWETMLHGLPHQNLTWRQFRPRNS